MAPATVERRSAACEIRAAGRKLTGYAAKFCTEARIGDMVETIAPGAFSDAIAGNADIIALADHDPAKVLARTKAGTLRLREDETGLHFETGELPNTTAANDVLELVRSGIAGGMSFGFMVPQGGDRWSGNRRELVKVDLREISVISSWPAYPQTSVQARARMSESTRLRLARMFLETV